MLSMFQRRNRPPVKAPRKPSVTVSRNPGIGRSDNWVPAIRSNADLPTAPINSDVGHSIDVTPNSQAKIDFKTSAVDRALGFLISSVPLYAAFALGILIVAVSLWGLPIWSFAGFMVYWLSFLAAWVVGYLYTLAVSAEGIALFEARQKWGVIKEEQRRRWDHYDRLTGDDEMEVIDL